VAAANDDLDKTASKPAIGFGDVIGALYVGILGRPADRGGLESYIGALNAGLPLSNVIRDMIASEEFKSKQKHAIANGVVTPDLTKLFPTKYVKTGPEDSIFKASSDDDFDLMESLIVKHRYYDSFGVWAPQIDLDKRVTAAIAKGFGGQSCIELGCFTGPVLSLLAEQGIDVCGVEVSHLAFVLAHANVHERIRFGDLLDLQFDRTFDLFLGMDILEHLNPLKLDRYIACVAQLVKRNGFVYINSPMFGKDDVFGTVFEPYLPEWRQAGEATFWRYLHCDAKGWPMHGHLVWASPRWWEGIFLKLGLVRDRNIEKTIHAVLGGFFEKIAPARKSFFVLRHSDFAPNDKLREDLISSITPVVAGLS
jgi:SAM-dependent methyltransferase